MWSTIYDQLSINVVWMTIQFNVPSSCSVYIQVHCLAQWEDISGMEYSDKEGGEELSAYLLTSLKSILHKAWLHIYWNIMSSKWRLLVSFQPVNPKGNQSWIFTGRTDVEAEAPKLWSPDAKSWLTGKDTDARKDWEQEEKKTKEEEMVGWHHWFNGHEFEQTLGDSEGREAWSAAVRGVAKSRTQLSNWIT